MKPIVRMVPIVQLILDARRTRTKGQNVDANSSLSPSETMARADQSSLIATIG